MPFKSDKQRKWMHANEPEMAKKWEKEESIKGKLRNLIRQEIKSVNEDNIKFSKEEMAQLHKDGKLEKGGHTIEFGESVNEGSYEAKQILAVLKLNQDVDEPVRMQIIGNRNKSKMLNVSPDAIKKIAKIMRNESINESDLGLTYKKGKTVKVTHKKSGKELIIIDKPNVKREYEKIGFYAEGQVNELSMAPFSSPEARTHINSDIKDMSRHLGKASQQVIKIMMSGVKSGKYTAMDISRGIKEGPTRRTHFGEMTFIQSLWTKMREKFRKYSKDRKLS